MVRKAAAQDHFRLFLAGKNLRLTPDRLAILDAALENESHFDVDGLLQRLRRRGQPASRATTYRTMDLLVQSGVIGKVPAPETGQALFEPVFGRQHHDHMFCLGCGAVLEFFDPRLEALQEEICAAHGFVITGHVHRLQGYCRACTPSRSVPTS